MQHVWVGNGSSARVLELPPADHEVLPGVDWGCASNPSTPAYWAARCQWPSETIPGFVTPDGSLLEEIGFCLLGGFGIRYEVNAAAFRLLKERGVFVPTQPWDEDDIVRLLREPLRINGRSVHYRFPNQRGNRIAAARQQAEGWDIEGFTPLELRERLLHIKGIGPKTASWIVRNLLGSDEVAILDVHVIRTCSRMAVFPRSAILPRDYAFLERRFIEFARGIGVRASILDAVMWSEVRRAYD